MEKKRVLVIDDEKNIRELIKYNLEESGFSVVLAADGREALEKLDGEVDLVVLDLMLPGIDGLALCRRLRNSPDYRGVPIIMLTARGEELDRVLGLEMGADDYITKPFSPRELVARIKALFRRIEDFSQEQKVEDGAESGLMTTGEITLDERRYEVYTGEQSLELTPKEFSLLKFLMVNRHQVLTRELLLEKIWGYEYMGDTRTVDVHIRRLRQKIGEQYIRTVRGVGYQLVEME